MHVRERARKEERSPKGEPKHLIWRCRASSTPLLAIDGRMSHSGRLLRGRNRKTVTRITRIRAEIVGSPDSSTETIKHRPISALGDRLLRHPCPLFPPCFSLHLAIVRDADSAETYQLTLEHAVRSNALAADDYREFDLLTGVASRGIIEGGLIN